MRPLLAAALVLTSLSLAAPGSATRPFRTVVASTCATCQIPDDDGRAAETRAPVLPTAAG